MEARPLELSELLDRLRWLISLRWVAAAGVAIIVAALEWLVGIDLQVVPLFVIALAIALYNLAFWMYLQGSAVSRQPSAVGDEGTGLRPPAPDPCLVANLQIALDLVALTFLLHFVGGVENPFFLYYVFHVIIASILLSREATYLQATFATALFSALAILEYSGLIAHVPVPELGSAGLYSHTVYVIAVLAALASTLYFAAFMATSIVRGLRVRESQIIELKEALENEEYKLQDAYFKLQGLDRFKSQYMRKVSHELRAPLSSIQSLITVVLEGFTGAIPAETREILSRASIRTKELLDMVSDLLSLSRAREIRPEQTRQEVSLAEIAGKIIPLFQAQAIDKGLEMEISVQPDLPPIWADPEGMEELLSNLVSNAIKYSPPGGKVQVTLEASDGEVVITVSDTGVGIEPEEMPHLFEEFFRSKKARAMVREGTGLGLAIVKAIADAHGGRVEVRSKVGEGTTFVVRIPSGGGGKGGESRVEGEGQVGEGQNSKRETGERNGASEQKIDKALVNTPYMRSKGLRVLRYCATSKLRYGVRWQATAIKSAGLPAHSKVNAALSDRTYKPCMRSKGFSIPSSYCHAEPQRSIWWGEAPRHPRPFAAAQGDNEKHVLRSLSPFSRAVLPGKDSPVAGSAPAFSPNRYQEEKT